MNTPKTDCPASIVIAENLRKEYDNFLAVKNVDFTVEKGECFGLLGPNGAGKSTIVRMVYGFTPITSGSLLVLGKNIVGNSREIKAKIGVVAQDDNLDPELSVLDNLQIYATYFRIDREQAKKRASEILEFMDLTTKAESVVEHLSGGLKRRLTIGRALLNEPELLILDEPTTGLDPYARHLVWQRLRKLKESGTTMILTTHYLEEASQLCDRLIVINKGEILEQGSPQELIDRHVGKEALELGIELSEPDSLIQWGGKLIKAHQTIGDDIVLFTDFGKELLERIVSSSAKEHIPITYQRLRPTNLEDVFLKLTGESLADAENEEGEY